MVWTAQCGQQSLATLCSQLAAPSRSQLFCVPGGSRAVEVTLCRAGAEPAAQCLWCAWDKITSQSRTCSRGEIQALPYLRGAPFRSPWMDGPVVLHVLHWYVLCTVVWAWSFCFQAIPDHLAQNLVSDKQKKLFRENKSLAAVCICTLCTSPVFTAVGLDLLIYWSPLGPSTVFSVLWTKPQNMGQYRHLPAGALSIWP